MRLHIFVIRGYVARRQIDRLNIQGNFQLITNKNFQIRIIEGAIALIRALGRGGKGMEILRLADLRENYFKQLIQS